MWEIWELACKICGKYGLSISCGNGQNICGKWLNYVGNGLDDKLFKYVGNVGNGKYLRNG